MDQKPYKLAWLKDHGYCLERIAGCCVIDGESALVDVASELWDKEVRRLREDRAFRKAQDKAMAQAIGAGYDPVRDFRTGGCDCA